MKLIDYARPPCRIPARPIPVYAMRYARINAARLLNQGYTLAMARMGRYYGMVAKKDRP